MRIGGVENLSFFPTSEFPYMLIKFLLHSSLVKSDNEIGKISYQDMVCLRRTRQRMLESFYGPGELTLVSWVFRMRNKQCGSKNYIENGVGLPMRCFSTE